MAAALVIAGCAVTLAIALDRDGSDASRHAAPPAATAQDGVDSAAGSEEPSGNPLQDPRRDLDALTVRSKADIEALPRATSRVVGAGLDEAAVAALARLPALKVLRLRETETRRGVEALLDALAQIKSLEELEIRGGLDLRGVDLTALAALPGLRRFAVHEIQLGDDELAALTQWPALVGLDLNGSPGLTAQGLAHVASIRALEEFGFSRGPGLSAGDLAAFADHPRLRALHAAAPAAGADPGTPADVARQLRLALDRRQTETDSDEHSWRALARIPNLRSLHVSDRLLLDDAHVAQLAALPNLATLEIDGAQKVTMAALAKLPPSLRHLEIRGSSGLRGALPPNLRHLERLSFSWNRHIDDATVASLTQCTSLRSLCLKCCPNLTPECIASIAQLAGLRHLDLDGLPWLDDSHLRQLSALAELEHLAISGLRDSHGLMVSATERRPVGGDNAVSAAGLAELARLTKLRVLEMEYLLELDGDAFAPLRALPLAELHVRGTTLTGATPTGEAATLLWPSARVVDL